MAVSVGGEHPAEPHAQGPAARRCDGGLADQPRRRHPALDRQRRGTDGRASARPFAISDLTRHVIGPTFGFRTHFYDIWPRDQVRSLQWTLAYFHLTHLRSGGVVPPLKSAPSSSPANSAPSASDHSTASDLKQLRRSRARPARSHQRKKPMNHLTFHPIARVYRSGLFACRVED